MTHEQSPHDDPALPHELQDGFRLALDRLDETAGDRREKHFKTRLSDSMNIAGVLGGIKPGALIDSEVTAGEILDDLGLHRVSSVNQTVVVAKDIDIATLLVEKHKELLGTDDRAKRAPIHRDIGALLGYPSTSTDYFLARSETMYTPDELPIVRPSASADTASRHFQQLILSPDHWQDELEQYSEPLEAATKSLLPRTYDQISRQAARDRRRRKIGTFFGREPRRYRRPVVEVVVQ